VVRRLAEPASWPDLVRSTVNAQRLEPAATVRLKARVKPHMRASDMAALVDSATAPGSTTGSAPSDRREANCSFRGIPPNRSATLDVPRPDPR
jgi:hypothetical protein